MDCTRTLRAGMIQWPDDPVFELRRLADMNQGDDANVTFMAASVHIGTHIDAPMHFVAGQPGIDELSLDDLCGEATVVHLREDRDVGPEDFAHVPEKHLRRVLFRTANEKRWEKGAFDKGFAAISPAAARRLVEAGTRLVGVDYASVDRYDAADRPVHKILGAAGVIMVESVDLSGVEAGRYEMIALPIKLAGADGAPARVILRRLTED
ncbi:MAG: cyclase family protein [Phycisphaerales bacterium]|nr:MAG: cyclase family protein [Phycisphaerales bacterium]